VYHSVVGASLNVIRKDTFSRTAWKNGGGVTHEAIRVPTTGEPFLWRVSVAHIEKSGPFSDFDGYERKMLLLQGRGLKLRFGDGRRRELREVGDWVDFDGAIPTQCDLIDGPCVDLNLMTAKSLKTAFRLERLGDSVGAEAGRGETVLIFSLAAALALGDETGAATRLEPWDLAVLSQGAVRLRTLEPGALSVPNAVFIATISQ
jgi:environmental stress-induced protein Ves